MSNKEMLKWIDQFMSPLDDYEAFDYDILSMDDNWAEVVVKVNDGLEFNLVFQVRDGKLYLNNRSEGRDRVMDQDICLHEILWRHLFIESLCAIPLEVAKGKE